MEKKIDFFHESALPINQFFSLGKGNQILSTLTPKTNFALFLARIHLLAFSFFKFSRFLIKVIRRRWFLRVPMWNACFPIFTSSPWLWSVSATRQESVLRILFNLALRLNGNSMRIFEKTSSFASIFTRAFQKNPSLFALDNLIFVKFAKQSSFLLIQLIIFSNCVC